MVLSLHLWRSVNHRARYTPFLSVPGARCGFNDFCISFRPTFSTQTFHSTEHFHFSPFNLIIASTKRSELVVYLHQSTWVKMRVSQMVCSISLRPFLGTPSRHHRLLQIPIEFASFEQPCTTPQKVASTCRTYHSTAPVRSDQPCTCTSVSCRTS